VCERALIQAAAREALWHHRQVTEVCRVQGCAKMSGASHIWTWKTACLHRRRHPSCTSLKDPSVLVFIKI